MILRRLALPIALLLAASPGGVSAEPAAASWHSRVESKMGTRVEVRLWLEDASRAVDLLDLAMAEFDRIEADMSTYRPTSLLSRVNSGAAQGPIAVSAELHGLMTTALELSRLTRGAFDITYDSVGYLYDFRARRRPTGDEIDAALPTVDYRLVELDDAPPAIRFARAGVRVNLGGIAKGHAVEAVIALLAQAGVGHALASAGGDSRLLGDRRGQPWMIGIRDPADEARLVTRLALADEAISTSGDYERFFIEEGQRFHHIIDPQTGRSADTLRSATVIGPDATWTDGLSTSVFVLGADAGLALVERLPGYEAVVVDTERRVRFSSGLDPAR